MNNLIRAEGNPKMAMYTQILGAVVSVVLNYIFIFIFHWGIKDQLGYYTGPISFSYLGIKLFLHRQEPGENSLENLRPTWPVLGSIMAIGFAPFAMQIASCIQQLILNKTLMLYGGDMALAAIGILMSISTLLLCRY